MEDIIDKKDKITNMKIKHVCPSKDSTKVLKRETAVVRKHFFKTHFCKKMVFIIFKGIFK